MTARLLAWWRGLTPLGRTMVVAAALVCVVCVAAAVNYVLTGTGTSVIDPQDPGAAYVWVFALIALDAVIVIFPGETTLNAAATLAAQGKLELVPIIVMGALGAIVGDSALFWLARKFSRRVEPQVTRARANPRVAQALELLDSSAPALIVGGRYLPGMRFVVNGTMGMSDILYRRFLTWSIISGVLWSTYTTVLAYNIGLALGDYPLASFAISGLVTGIAITVVIVSVRRNRRRAAAD
ncbi:MAG: DedA family protein [Nocardioides sp.]